MTAAGRATLWSGLLLLAASFTGAQQPAEIQVGLGWLVLPGEVVITPRGAGAVISACSGCGAAPLEGPATFSVRGEALLDAQGRSMAGPVAVEGEYEMAMAGRAPLRLHFPLTLRAQGGRIRAVLRVPLESYVELALAGESADFTSDAALEAMAVTVRTYAIHQRGRHAKEGFDLCDATHCQLLRFDAGASARIRAAAEATAGELLWYRGEPAAAYYSGNCGGTTEDAARLWPGIAAPYLRAHADPYCVVHGRAEWTAEISKEELAHALHEAGWQDAGEHISAVRIVERTGSGRASRLEFRGAQSFVAGAEDVRAAINRAPGPARLRSNSYDVRDAGDRFVFHGYGLGHGAGLCQAGAQEMGAEGKSYREILAFYYPGTAVGLTAQGLEWTALHGERMDVLTTQPEADGALLPRAERILREAEEQTGWKTAQRPELRVYPSVAVYRNATGEPGWVAGSTKGRVIRLEPLSVLRAAGALDSTVRHELLHLLMESRANRDLPLWFREGLAGFLEHEAAPAGGETVSAGQPDYRQLDRRLAAPNSAKEARAVAREAQRAVARLVAQRGRGEVLSWVERGLPPDLSIRE
ncbi:MAG TPA: SpoIID/LytB domain-containing protein [Candidatus Binatia bacterium]|nr:SpoIID/LytB domain-containing protein [Candidatus Binatia bacterium]